MEQESMLTKEEEEFIQIMSKNLPAVIARKQIDRQFGGIIANRTVANAQLSGEGPAIYYKVGRTVVYETRILLIWLVKRLEFEKLNSIKRGMKKNKRNNPNFI
jgi:hypothetical protein